MKLNSKEHETAMQILAQFDPDRLKKSKLDILEDKLEQTRYKPDDDAKAEEAKVVELSQEEIDEIEKAKGIQQTKKKDLSIQAQSDKWDKISKQIDVEEQIEEVKETDFDQQRKQYMDKLIGCSKDHSKEIDLYEKTYEQKIERVKIHLK